MVGVAEVVLLSVVIAVAGILLYEQPGVTAGFQREPIPKRELSNELFDRRYEYFDSQESKLEAWLYVPKNVVNPPVVILANGVGLQKHFLLDKIAEVFVKRGIAAFVFDYRHIGGSEGEPRNVVKVSKQIADWHAAIKYVTTIPDINSKKIALWGNSLSGGHVITVASEQLARKNPNITCVVSQVPYLDTLDAMFHIKKPYVLNHLAVAFKDLVLSFFGKDQYISVFADRNTLGVLNVENPEETMKTLEAAEGLHGWHNVVPARTILELILYRPHMHASGVTVPALIVYAADDELHSAAQMEKTAATMPDVSLVKVNGTHFSIYGRTDTINAQADFLVKHLLQK